MFYALRVFPQLGPKPVMEKEWGWILACDGDGAGMEEGAHPEVLGGAGAAQAAQGVLHPCLDCFWLQGLPSQGLTLPAQTSPLRDQVQIAKERLL